MGYFPFDNYPSQVGDDIWLVLMDHQPQIPWDRGKPWAHPDGNDSWMVSMNPKIQKKNAMIGLEAIKSDIKKYLSLK